jgi:hypothetical protein
MRLSHLRTPAAHEPEPSAQGGKDLRQVLIARWGHEPLAKPMYPYDSKDAKSMPLAPDLKLLQSPAAD